MTYKSIPMMEHDPLLENIFLLATPTRRWEEKEIVLHSLDPSHLDVEQLFDYLEGRPSTEERATIETHLLHCDFCRDQLVEIVPVVHTTSEASAASTRNLSARWISKVTNLTTRSKQPLGALTPSLQFAMDASTMPLLSLHFDDEKTLVSIFFENGQRWIHMESKDRPIGTVLLVEIVDPEEQLRWRRFMVLRQGFRTQVARAMLALDPIEGCVMEVGEVQGETLNSLSGEGKEELFQSFLAAQRDDPASIPLWRAWAKKTSDESRLSTLLYDMLQRIAEGREEEENT